MLDVVIFPDREYAKALNKISGINAGENTPIKIWGSFSYNSGDENKTANKHNNKLRQKIISLGIESNIEDVKLGLALVYLDTQVTSQRNTQSAQKTKLPEFIGVIHAAKLFTFNTTIEAFNRLNVAAACLYGSNKNKSNNHHTFNTDTYSLALTPSYQFDLGMFNFNIGLASHFAHVNRPTYKRSDIDQEIKANHKTYFSNGPFVSVMVAHKLSATNILVSEFITGYTYISGVNNKDQLELLAEDNTITIIPQDEPIKYKFYCKAKFNMAVNDFSYGAKFSLSCDKNKTIYGGNIVIGYKF
jgi:hypothetical protein